MKKKEKTSKKVDMPEFSFKEFNTEEGRIYEDAVSKFRDAIVAGKTLRQAYESYPIGNEELERLIQVDFLKILIAERYFGQHQAMEDIARELDVPLSLIKETHARMLQEVGVTASSQFGEEFTGILPKTSD